MKSVSLKKSSERWKRSRLTSKVRGWTLPTTDQEALYQTNGENYFSEKYQYNNVYKSKFDRRLFEDRDKSYDRFRNPNDPHTRYMRQQNERQNKWQSERYRDKIGKYYDR